MTTDQLYFIINSLLIASTGSLVLAVCKVLYEVIKKIQKDISDKVDEDTCLERKTALKELIDEKLKER